VEVKKKEQERRKRNAIVIKKRIHVEKKLKKNLEEEGKEIENKSKDK
tara:strand:+ start:28 stop:168 length:141 start_codon:yes stop_codon:yes gene_type:complete